MCIQPREFNGRVILCRQCWQCQEQRVDDIVGRCIAEQKVATNAYTVTLTYGGDDRITGEVNLKARLLHFRDVSLYLKRLRKFCRIRYVGAGEYGDARGRGHWHLIIFTYGQPIPNLRLNTRYVHDAQLGGVTYTLWADGWSYWEPATY